MFDSIREDIASIKERDPAARSGAEVFFLYSGVHALIYYRIAHWLYLHKRFGMARWVSQHAKFSTGIEIHPGAKIGKALFIDHGMGVVIGETAEIGDYCTLYQGVTLGGTGKDKGKRHPTLGNNVMVGAGAKILGPFKVGNNAKVGANALVLNEVPENATAVGVPAHVVKVNGERVKKTQALHKKGPCSDLDQIHMPDPIQQEFCAMKYQVEKLQKEVSLLQQKLNDKSENEN